MLIQAALLPLFVEVALTFVLLFWMGGLNIAAVQSGAVRPQEAALREPNWSALELSILFYVLTARHADLVFVLLAWVFVALRCLQAFFHVTDNDVRRRGALLVSGAIVLAVMWAIFAIRILLGI